MTKAALRTYIETYIKNSSVEAFTNLRLQTALLEMVDDALTSSVGDAANTTALQLLSGADFTYVIVTGSGIYEYSSTGTANGTTIFAATGGGTWNQRYSVDATTDAADFTALSALSGANYKYVFVTDEGVFKYLSSGTPNGTTIFAASGGGTWNLVFNAGVDTPQLSTPVLTLTVISDTQINATWASVTDAANYQLYMATASDFTGETLVYDGALLLFNSTGLSASTTYYFRLKARGYERMNSAFDSDTATTDETVAILITANRIFQHDFSQVANNRVFNMLGGNTENDNLIGLSEQHFVRVATFAPPYFNSNECTLTPGFTNKDGKQTAYRCETLSGATVSGTTGNWAGERIQGRTFTAGAKKLSLFVKSNTGSTQIMRMAYGNSTDISSDITVPTTWTEVEWTFTHLGDSDKLNFVINGSAGTPLDILIDKVSLKAQTSLVPYVTPKLDFFLGHDGTTESNDPTLISGKGLAFDGAQFAMAISDEIVNTPTLSVYWVGKITTTSAGYGFTVSTGYGDIGFELVAGKGGTVDHIFPPYFRVRNSGTSRAPAQTLKLADNSVHVLTGVYDGAYTYLYVDGILFAKTPYVGGSVSINRLLLSDSDAIGDRFMTGEGYDAVGYTDAHTAEQVMNNYLALSAIAAAKGITMAANDTFIVTTGDSLSDVDQSGTWPRKACYLFTTNVLSENVAVVGRTMKPGINSIENDAVLIDSYYDASRTNNILNVFIGANDIAAPTGFIAADFVDDLKAFCLARRVVGWKICVCTLLARTVNDSIANRNAVNPLIVADTSFYDARVDLHLDATIGTDAACLNATYFPDGTHLSDAGYEIIAPLVKAKWDTLIM